MWRKGMVGGQFSMRTAVKEQALDTGSVHDLEYLKVEPIDHAVDRSSLSEQLKRLADIIVSAALILFISPLLICIALIVRQDGGPALFAHERVGRGGKSFKCLKFRSMRINAEEALEDYLEAHPEARREWIERQKLKEDVRITKIGRTLRLWSLDELPQLFNVLRGDMSLIGPRPITVPELNRYGSRAKYYLQRTPGISGLWQVSGRNKTTYRRRVAIDTIYAKRFSLALDLSILLRTIPTVLLRRGAE